MYSRRPPGGPPISRSQISATVKWFNSTKGFGFLSPADGSPDAFLHASVVQRAGYDALPEGATVICDLAQGQKGPQVSNIHSVDLSTASASPPRREFRGAPRDDYGGGGRGGRDDYGGGRSDYGGGRSDFGGGARAPSRYDDDGGYGGGAAGGESMLVEGTVKFFNAEKGFGFVVPDGGGKDIYVHARALQRSGLHSLNSDDRVRIKTRMGNRGVEADKIEMIEEAGPG